MNKSVRIITTVCYGLIMVFVNVMALLFFLGSLPTNPGAGGGTLHLPGISGKYALLFYLVAIFAPAFIAVSLGNLLRRFAGFTPDFLRRIFWTELGGLLLFFLALFLIRYYQLYR